MTALHRPHRLRRRRLSLRSRDHPLADNLQDGQHCNGHDRTRHLHIQNQNTSDKITSAGFKVKRGSGQRVYPSR